MIQELLSQMTCKGYGMLKLLMKWTHLQNQIFPPQTVGPFMHYHTSLDIIEVCITTKIKLPTLAPPNASHFVQKG